MPVANPIPDDKKVDHLILLVGGNPLPNIVAGKLLVRPRGRITLLHSKTVKQLNIQGTHEIANRIKSRLENESDLNVQTRGIEESNPDDIRREVESALDGYAEAASVGLNYTGGTKAMAVHAYLGIARWSSQKGLIPVFSYLDPRTLQMRFDGGLPEHVGLAVNVSLEDMLFLHGDLVQNRYHRAKDSPILPQSATQTLWVYLDDEKTKDWFAWRKKHLKPLRLDSPSKNKSLNYFQNWIDDADLRKTVVPWPPHVGSVLLQELQSLGYTSADTDMNIGNVAETIGVRLAEEFTEWLWGQWLEHYTLSCLQQVATQWGFHTTVTGVETFPRRFEVDVVGIRGYQLFALSCSTDAANYKVKPKLFEAYVRAQQLGGDEARLALVCFNDKPTWLRDELKSTIDPRVMVFGTPQLENLADELSQWIETQVGKG